MTRCSSFIRRCLSSLFSGLASGVRCPASSSGCRPAFAKATVGRPSSVVRRPSFPVPPSPKGLRWAGRRLSSGVRRPSLGFSLVEVTLALMVMAIGILSIMSLFPAGLDQNARSIADTHAAFFAEEVFGGLHARAETNWAGLDMDLPIAAAANWYQPNDLYTVLTSGLTNKYIRTDNTNYVDHALRYRLVLTTNGLLKAATLWIWPGEFGSINDPSMFYAEFFRFKP